MGCMLSTSIKGSTTETSPAHHKGGQPTPRQISKKNAVKKKPLSIGSTTGSKSKSSASSSVHKRLPDRDNTNSLSVVSGGTDEYVDRLSASPEEDNELQMEIVRRQNSAVRAKVNKYDQLQAKSRFAPPLVEVRQASLSEQSGIYNRVQSFEVIERESKVDIGPPLEELRRRRDMRDQNRFSNSHVLPAQVYSL